MYQLVIKSISGYTLSNEKFIYYLLITIGLVTVLFTNPFLRYPYDAIHHLILINEWTDSLTVQKSNMVGIFVNNIYIVIPDAYQEVIDIPKNRHIWHYIWAEIFNIFNIDNSKILFRAKIIHIVQTYIALFTIYYFSNVIIRNLFKQITQPVLRYLSLWSVLIWISIFSTFSGLYHQIWNMWYSVNYQITLPLFWYMTALTLVLLLENTSIRKKIFFILQILILSRFILQAHSMEFMYYLMYILVFTMIYIDKAYILIKKHYYILIFIVGSIYYFIKNHQLEKSKIFNYLSIEKLPLLYNEIMLEGDILIKGLNRASSSVNELMYFIFYMGIGIILYFLWSKYKHKKIVLNTRIFFFIIITSLFAIIPLFQFSGGLFGIITYKEVVNRLYYSSSLFVLLPIIIYYILTTYTLKLRYINLALLISLVFIYTYSKYNNSVSHNYYKNIQSIKNSFSIKKVGFNLSKKQISLIGQKLYNYEIKNTSNRKEFYYARADIAFVLKYIYKKKVYWEGRRANPNYVKIYTNHKDNKDYHQILFETPKHFPVYRPYL